MFKYDTHVHTSETSPCGKIEGAAVVRLYKQAGYDGIIITDHYYPEYFYGIKSKSWEAKINKYLDGYKNAFKEGQKAGLRVLLGIELRFEENPNDYLVFGINEDFLKQNPELYKLGLKNFRKLIAGSTVLIYQAHPFRNTVYPADPDYLDGVEVFNGNPRHDSMNHKAMEFAENYNLKKLSGSDFHQKMDLARGGVRLPEMPVDSTEFAQLLRADRISDLIISKD